MTIDEQLAAIIERVKWGVMPSEAPLLVSEIQEVRRSLQTPPPTTASPEAVKKLEDLIKK